MIPQIQWGILVDLISFEADNSLMLTSKGNEMTENEKSVFGMSKDDIRSEYMDSLTARCSGLEMVVAGILSDCQELVNGCDTTSDSVRKQLNVAKFILFEMMDKKETV